jgi:O-antigen ligase
MDITLTIDGLLESARAGLGNLVVSATLVCVFALLFARVESMVRSGVAGGKPVIYGGRRKGLAVTILGLGVAGVVVCVGAIYAMSRQASISESLASAMAATDMWDRLLIAASAVSALTFDFGAWIYLASELV